MFLISNITPKEILNGNYIVQDLKLLSLQITKGRVLPLLLRSCPLFNPDVQGLFRGYLLTPGEGEKRGIMMGFSLVLIHPHFITG